MKSVLPDRGGIGPAKLDGIEIAFSHGVDCASPLVYVAAKFAGDSNRSDLERVVAAVEGAGCRTGWFVRDVERWGNFWTDNRKIMAACRIMIDSADLVFAEVSDKGVGVGWECGYAAGRGKFVVAAAREGSDVSPNLQASVDLFIFYRAADEITAALGRVLSRHD